MPTAGINGANHIPIQTQTQVNTQTQKTQEQKTPGVMGKDDFLKLFLTSLQYQDPMNAMDMNQMMNQMSQMTLIEQVQNMTEAVDSLRATMAVNPLDGGMKYLGKYIEGVDSEGKLVSGKVDVVRLARNNEVQLVVGDHVVSLGYVVNVSDEPIKNEPDSEKPELQVPDRTNPTDDKANSVTTTNK